MDACVQHGANFGPKNSASVESACTTVLDTCLESCGRLGGSGLLGGSSYAYDPHPTNLVASVDAINKLAPAFAKQFLPGLMHFLNNDPDIQNEIKKEVAEGDTCYCLGGACVGGLGLKLFAGIKGISFAQLPADLTNPDKGGLTSVTAEPVNSKQIKLKVRATGIVGRIEHIGVRGEACAGVGVECSLGFAGNIAIPVIDAAFLVSVVWNREKSRQQIKLEPAPDGFNLWSSVVYLHPPTELSACSAVSSLLTPLANTLANSFTVVIAPFIKSSYSSWIETALGPLMNDPLPPIPSVDLGTAMMDIRYEIESLTVHHGEIRAAASWEIHSVLKTGDWRDRRRLVLPEALGQRDTTSPIPSPNGLVAVAVNPLIADSFLHAIWYGAWPTIAVVGNDTAFQDRGYDGDRFLCCEVGVHCALSPYDPCPFPPHNINPARTKRASVAGAALAIVFEDVLPSFRQGFRYPNGWNASLVIPPPILNIKSPDREHTQGSMTANSTIKMVISVDHSVLMTIERPFGIQVSVPRYHASNGTLYDFKLSSPYIGPSKVSFAPGVDHRWEEGQNQNAIFELFGVRSALEKQIAAVNNAAAKTLPNLDLRMPPFQDVPLKGQTLVVDVTDARVEALNDAPTPPHFLGQGEAKVVVN